jgi:hypothetical protein
MKHKKLAIAIFGGLLVVGITAGCKSTTSATGQTTSAPASAATTTSAPALAKASATPAPPTTPAMTASQQQAVDTAQNYLSDSQGFSYNSLLQQLTSSYGDGYSQSDAKFAIRYLHPDWNAQAVIAAKNYLSDGQGFSKASLLQQLTSSYGDQFTQAQGQYAVDQTMGG